MIRYIGITGKARAGKDTVCNVLLEQLPYSTRYALADPIRAAVFAMLGLDTLSDRLALMNDKDKDLEYVGTSPRALMQEIGGGLRSSISEDIWIRFLEHFANESLSLEEEFRPEDDDDPLYIIVPDVRYNNEAKFIKNNDGIVVHVVRPDVESVREHQSEAGIDFRYVDHRIENNGTLEDLKQKTKQLIKEELS